MLAAEASTSESTVPRRAPPDGGGRSAGTDLRVRAVREQVPPLLRCEVAAGDPAGEALQRRSVRRPLDRRGELEDQQPAVGLEDDARDPAVPRGEVAADALARVDVPEHRAGGSHGEQPPIWGE